MARGDKTLSYSFRGSAEDLKRLQQLIGKAVELAFPPIDPQGPVEDWGQSGGWVPGSWRQLGAERRMVPGGRESGVRQGLETR